MKVGDRIRRPCSALGKDAVKDCTVVYIHPEWRYYTVQFDTGIKETFDFSSLPEELRNKIMKRGK